MMTSSNGNIFRVTGHLREEFTGPRWFPCTKPVTRRFSLICVWINGWVNTREAGDLRRYRAHYDVIVMQTMYLSYCIRSACNIVVVCRNMHGSVQERRNFSALAMELRLSCSKPSIRSLNFLAAIFAWHAMIFPMFKCASWQPCRDQSFSVYLYSILVYIRITAYNAVW